MLWLPEFAGLEGNSNAGAVLTAAFRQFEQNNPGLRVDVQVKSETGKASIFNYLHSSQLVAPSILPDLVLINTQQLWQLADVGIVPPLAPAEILQPGDYYQSAFDAVSYQEQTLGIPFASTVVHSAYFTDQLPKAPVTWKDLFTYGQSYLIPGGGDGFNNASMLVQYVGAGGQLLADGSISSPDALQAMFNFLVDARAARRPA